MDGLHARRRRLRELDSTHLTAQADSAWAGSYAPFVPCSDIFLPEIYSIKEKTPTGLEVAEVVRDMGIVRSNIEEAGDGPKSVWAALQQFAGWSTWRRFPSRAELRACAYAAIIHGAKGLVWYTYAGNKSKSGRGAKDDQEKWEDLCGLVRELAGREEILLARDADEQPKVAVLAGPTQDPFGRQSVTCLLKNAPQGEFLMAVNATTNAVSAAFSTSRGAMRRELGPYGVLSEPFMLH